MAWDEEENTAALARQKQKNSAYMVGVALDAFSEDDLATLILSLKEEIVRVEAALSAKKISRRSAEAFFKS